MDANDKSERPQQDVLADDPILLAFVTFVVALAFALRIVDPCTC